MIQSPVARVSASLFWTVVAVAGLVVPVQAQYRPIPTVGSGPKAEPYHVEAAINWWDPAPDFIVASKALNVQGTSIDVQADLDIQKKSAFEFRLELRPAKKHKFRLYYLPLTYEGNTTLKADITFNGVTYPISTQVDSKLQWKTLRIGYEFDFISRSQGFLGVLIEAKYTDASVQIRSPFGIEVARARAPIPAIGAVGRVYIGRIASVTGEFTAFKLPDTLIETYNGHYYDWDIYGGVELTHNFGVRVGYRSLDLGVVAGDTSGAAGLTGFYLGGVARF